MSTRAAVLVVDDEPGIRDMLSFELSQEGFDVETAENGLAAVEALRRRKFDLAVTDLKMPGMDGVATVEALRAIDPDIEVIVATGYASVETAVACMKRGAYDYIQKPYDLNELKLLFDRAMEKSHLQGVVALFEASRAILATVKHSELFRLVLGTAERVLKANAALLLWQDGTDRFDVHRLDSREQPSDAILQELARRTTASGSSLCIPSARAREMKIELKETGHVLALLYPLTGKKRPLGLLALFRREGSPTFVRSELQKGNVFANQLGLSLDNARLYEELESKISELVTTRDQLVQAGKLAVADHLAGAVAHEINNPLAFVRADRLLTSLRTPVASIWTLHNTCSSHHRRRTCRFSLSDAYRQRGRRGGRCLKAFGNGGVRPMKLKSIESGALVAALLSSFSAFATWTLTTPMDASRISRNSGVALSDGRVVFATSAVDGITCDASAVYSPADGNWITTGCMSPPHVFDPAVILGNRIVSVGQDGNCIWLDIPTLAWSRGQDAQYSQGQGAFAALDGTRAIVVADESLTDGSRCELYDSTTSTWSPCASTSFGRHRATATRLQDGRVLVAAGYAEGTNSAEIYDSDTDRWSLTGEMRFAHQDHAATLLNDGRVLVVGGRPNPSSAEIFDPATGQWSVTASPGGYQPEGHVLITMNDGMVLLVGGGLLDGSIVGRAAKLFDPVSETWSDAGSMNVGRVAPMAANLADGSVLLAGGVSACREYCVFDCYCDPVYTPTAEIFTR